VPNNKMSEKCVFLLFFEENQIALTIIYSSNLEKDSNIELAK
jgi:hypothetical protein